MLGVRLDPETERGLEELARASRRTKSDLAREAVRAMVRANGLTSEESRQLAAIRTADASFDWDFWEAISTQPDA